MSGEIVRMRAVALLYDELTRPDLDEGERKFGRGLRTGKSHDLRAGVGSVKVPDPEWDSVGGIVPDLILYGSDDSQAHTNHRSGCQQVRPDQGNEALVVVITVADLCPTASFTSLTSRDNFSINYAHTEL